MKYTDILNEAQAATNNVFMFFVIAFTEEEAEKELQKALDENGLTKDDIHPIGGGAYTTQEGFEQLKAIQRRKAERIKNEILPDDGELIKAIIAEAFNQELFYSHDLGSVLKPFGLTEDETDERIKADIDEAIKQYTQQV